MVTESDCQDDLRQRTDKITKFFIDNNYLQP